MAEDQGRVVIQELARRLNPKEKWRVDWLGDRYPQGSANVQPMIDVFLSPLYPGSNGYLTAPRAADVTRQVRVQLGVGYLPLLYKGAIFQAGEQVGVHPTQVYSRRLNIAPAHSSLIGLQDNIPRFFGNEQSRWPLLSSEYTLGPLAWAQWDSSKILCIADINGIDPHYVMISGIEVARFFCCTTSVLARSAFSHGWENLIWKAKCDTTKLRNEVTVGMQKVLGLKLADARHLAYKVIDDKEKEEGKNEGKTAALLAAILRSIQSTSQNRRSKPPLACHFPFVEDTEIVAEVVRIPTGTQLRERFFVTRLVRCQRPIPFDICFGYPMIHPGQGENKDDPNLKPFSIGRGKPEPQSKLESENRDVPGTSTVASNESDLKKHGKLDDAQGPPSKGLREILLRSPEDRFDGLTDVPAPLAPKSRQEYKNIREEKKRRRIIEADGLSTGVPRGSRSIIPANIDTDALAKSSDPTIKLLLAAVPHLRGMGIWVEPLAVISLATYDSASKSARSWSSIENGESSVREKDFRSRLMVAIRIKLENADCIVVEIERKPGKNSTPTFGLSAFYLSPCTDIDDFLRDLARSVIHRKGWPMFDVQKKAFEVNEKMRVSGNRGHHKKVDDGEQMSQKIQNCFLKNPLTPLPPNG